MAMVLAMVAAGYLLVGWRDWRSPDLPVPLDSLDLDFIHRAVELNSEAGDSAQTASSTPGGHRVAQLLDLNRADSLALLDLPGIGPTKATAILAWRRQHGSFRRIEDLLEVSGIGPSTLARLKGSVMVRPELGSSRKTALPRKGASVAVPQAVK